MSTNASSISLYRYSVPTLLQSIAVDSVIPFIALYLVQTLSYRVDEAAGLIGTAIAITTAIRLVLGRVIDKLDKRVAGRVGLVLLSFLPVALLLKMGYGVILLAMILSTVGDILFSNSTINLIYRELDDKQAKMAVSHFYAAANAATCIVPALTLAVGTERLGSIFVFSIVAAAVALIVYSLVFRSERVRDKQVEATAGRQTSRKGILVWALGVGVGISLIYGHWTTTVPLALADLQPMGLGIFPTMMLLNGLLAVMFQPVYRRVCARVDLGNLPWFGSIFFALAFVVLALRSHSVVNVLLFMLLLTAGECLIFPAITSIICEAASPERRSTWLSIYGTTRVAGGASIAYGGVLLQGHEQSVFFAYLVAAAVPLLAISFGLRMALNRKNTDKAATPPIQVLG